MKNENLIARTSNDPLEEVCQRFPDVAQRHKFGVLGVHNLREKMASKGVEFPRECRVFDVCNPQQAKEVLDRSIEISTALPCRVSVYEEGGQTVLATIKPTQLLGLFGAPAAASTAQEVETALTEIMDATARGA